MKLGKRGLSVVLLCVATGSLLAQEHSPDKEKNPLAGNPAAIAAGARLYEQACQTCHGGDGTGRERAPGLAGAAFRHGGADGELFLNIRNGIASTQMPPFKRLTTEQVWQLVSYIRSLNRAKPVAAAAGGAAGNLLAGEQLFFGKAACASCHEVHARGASVGPDLSNAGRLSADLLRRKILDPGAGANPNAGGRRRGGGGGFVAVRTRDGRELRGVRRNEDTYTLILTDVSGRLHLLEKRDLAEIRAEPGSLMPADFGKQLSEAEIQDLVAFLKTLTGEPVAADLAKDTAAP